MNIVFIGSRVGLPSISMRQAAAKSFTFARNTWKLERCPIAQRHSH